MTCFNCRDNGYEFPCYMCGRTRAIEEKRRELESEIARLTEGYSAVESHWAKRGEEITRLRQVIEDAPHTPECAVTEWPGEDDEHCNCWISEALNQPQACGH